MARRSRGQRRRHAARQLKGADLQHASTLGQSSRLMSLPAELRNRIWSAVFEGTTQKLRSTTPSSGAVRSVYSSPPALLCTCKKVYAEALGLYYSSTTFVTYFPVHIQASARMVQNWMKSIGIERAKLIQTIRLQICHSPSEIMRLDDPENDDDFMFIGERHFQAYTAAMIIEVDDICEPVVQVDVCYEWEQGRFAIWSSAPDDTHWEMAEAYSHGPKAFEQWLIGKGSDISTELHLGRTEFWARANA
ncbi:uncharacterized protein RHO25_001976 [Cercospora beticola]|uniref:2EXR domain-containing protein n=1 Tax=Cercospora beticola TaxID=122368 RepID=A0ABZ0NCV2_CERBT|nr:hypothetical protein RHO25_001976 [Cercospora beticola]